MMWNSVIVYVILCQMLHLRAAERHLEHILGNICNTVKSISVKAHPVRWPNRCM